MKDKIDTKYQFTGFISSGTYGRVYRARGINGVVGDFAIKKFKPDKEGTNTSLSHAKGPTGAATFAGTAKSTAYTGISQSAIREMGLCAELRHQNLVRHIETILQDASIYMVFSFCAHDLLQIIHRHGQSLHAPIPGSMLRSILHQLLGGLKYLHENWVMHRDLKPANIMLTSTGQIKIGDLGLARIFREPSVPLFSGDKVVVTIWYRAPELLMGARHYTPAIDLWALGCIMGELLCLKPMFKGEEAKGEGGIKKEVPWQRHQVLKIVEVLGMMDEESWPSIEMYPEAERELLAGLMRSQPRLKPVGLEEWFWGTVKAQGFTGEIVPGQEALNLLRSLLQYDPTKRISAAQALEHPYFTSGTPPSENCFEGTGIVYPARKIAQDEASANAMALPGTKRGGLPDDSRPGVGKRLRV